VILFVARRFLSAVPLLFLLAALTFFLLRLAPGGPFDAERAWPVEVRANIDREYGLDQPVVVQFGRWFVGAVQGDFHTSFQYLGRPVSEMISEAMPVSLALGFYAIIFSMCLGFPLGAVSAARPNTMWDHSAMFFAVSGVSLPTYLVASLLVLVFSLWLGWVPPALLEEPSAWILPAITLGWRPMAMIARLTRASMLEVMKTDFVRTAYSKGLASEAVIFRHVLKNSLVPVVTLMGPVVANLVTGSFVVELIFQLPGLGKYFVQAVINRDYPLVMGVTLVYGVVLVLSNLVVDLLYAWIDPRIRLGAQK